MPERKFIYNERSEEQYNRRAAQRGGGVKDSFYKEGTKVFTPRIDETNRIRILPPTWDKPEHYGYDIWVHYGIGVDNSAFLCLEKMKGEKCPICEALRHTTNDPIFVKKLKAKRKVLVYLLDRKEEEAGAKAWAMPWGLDKNYVIQSRDEDTGAILKIDHPDEGYDVYFDTVKATKDVAYTYEGEKIARKPSPISSDPRIYNRVLEQIVEKPLPTILQFYDAQYIKKVFEGNFLTEDVNGDIEEETLEIPTIESKIVEDKFVDKISELKKRYAKE